jgi:hypothetical protein
VKADLLATCFHAGLFLGLLFNLEGGGDINLLKRLLTFNGLHGVISQEIELY